ncbi:hypothetical protein [Brevifollis gellanilyticus]|uniref:Uncharacterized protein n=1 Tax=Brevifollis gellanilyticus TaxID=748831 RepID=A0A512MD06_9BACT|nr:hypothetical protein [Brevifollis gellanilyticus]GEP44620.1 hypothetical protein BGE01nite_39110 [Brevifollis gellanilyticus]
MKTIASLLFAMSLAAASAADSPDSEFPKVGDTYRIATSAPLVEAPFDNVVTVVAIGKNEWAKVQYEKMGRGADGSVGKQKHEMWVNFSAVTSAVKSEAK